MRTLDHAIEAIGRRPVRKLDPPVLAALRLGAYQLGYSELPAHAVVDDSVELVRRGAARARGAVHERGHAPARREASRPARLAPRGAAQALVPRLDLRRLARATSARRRRSRSCARRTSRPRPSSASCAATRPASRPTSPARTASSASTSRRSRRGASGRRAAASQLAALVVGLADGRARARLVRGARRQGDDARGRGDRGRAASGPRARAAGRTSSSSARRTCTSSRRTRPTCRPSSTASTARSSTRRARGSACSRARPDLRWRARPLPDLQLALLREAAERTNPGGTIVYSVCTINADENEAVVDASGLDVEPLGEEWPQFAHPKRPEFLLTRPDQHGTSGFFIARLRV